MERIYFVAFCGILLLSNTVFGQVGSLAGIATDGYHPIPFAHISVASTEGKTVVTNMNGEFTINNIPVGVQTIVVSSIGFRNFTQKVEIEEGKTVKLPTISLKEDALGLNEVVVTGTMQEIYMINSPVKVEVIPMNFIQKSIAPTNIIESIALINGVQEVVSCGVCYTNSISINGLPGPYTAILMDGSPIYGNLASIYGLNGIPSQIIDRFEVIKGPVSTLYGSEAVAGVINIITKDPAQQPLLSVDMMATSHLESYNNIAFAPKLGKLKGYVGLHHAYVDDYSDNNSDGFGDVAALDRLSLFSKWQLDRTSEKKFTFGAKYYYEDRRNGVESYMKNRAYKELRGNAEIYGESIYTHRGELFGTYELNTRFPLKADYSFSSHQQDSYYGADFYKASQQIGFINLTSAFQKGKHHLLIGSTLRYQNYDDNTVATATSADEQIIIGGFLQDEWKFTDRLSLLTGARVDYYDSHGFIFAPRVNLKVKPEEWSTIRGSFGTGFRIVNLFTEDHAFVTGQREVEILEDLSPESSYNLSLNLNHVYTLGGSQGMLDFDIFYTYFTNKIIPDYDTPSKIIYANSNGNAITKGIGMSFQHQFAAPLSFNLGLNWQNATQTEENEEGILETTKIEFATDWTAILTANYSIRKKRLDFAFNTQITGPMQLPEVFDLDAEGNQLDKARPTRSQPFVLQSFQITKTFNKGFSLYGGIQNLFDYQQTLSPLTGFNDPNALPGFSEFFDTAYAFSVGHRREVYLGFRWNLGRK